MPRRAPRGSAPGAVGARPRRRPAARPGAARRLVDRRRRRRLHARRRARLAGPALRPGVRRGALVRGRHTGRRARPGPPATSTRAVPRPPRRRGAPSASSPRWRSSCSRWQRSTPATCGTRPRRPPTWSPLVGMGGRRSRRADLERRARRAPRRRRRRVRARLLVRRRRRRARVLDSWRAACRRSTRGGRCRSPRSRRSAATHEPSRNVTPAGGSPILSRRRPFPRGRRQPRHHDVHRAAWRRYAEIRHAGGAVARGRARAPSRRWATATTSSSSSSRRRCRRTTVAAATERRRRRRRRSASGSPARTYLNGLDGPARCARGGDVDRRRRPRHDRYAAPTIDPAGILRYGVDHRR